MINLEILEKFGCDTDTLKRIFTCSDPESNDHKVREKLEETLAAKLDEGIKRNLINYRHYHVADMAWDAAPIAKEKIPLMKYAQGLLKETDLLKELKDAECDPAKFIVAGQDGKPHVNVPAFFETPLNLVRSYIIRRWAAQTSRLDVHPIFKYDPRGVSDVEKLRADVVTQRVDIMGDQYDYTRFFQQSILEMFLYGHSIAFLASAWDVEEQYSWELGSSDGVKLADRNVESHVVKEGVLFTNPHPSRVFYDINRPLSGVNTNNGPDWIGYWDLVPYRELRSDSFWNLEDVSYGSAMASLFSSNRAFFSYYFPGLKLPQDVDSLMDASVAENDRKAALGKYVGRMEDNAVFRAVVNMRLIPAEHGLGDYPYPVWVRFVVSNNGKVIFAEYLPSIPAIFGGININDSKVLNVSMAHELIQFQGLIENILNMMFREMKRSLMQIWTVDEDALNPDMKKYIEETVRTPGWYTDPKVFFYSGKKMKSLDLNSRDFIKVIEKNMTSVIQDAFGAINQLLQILERLMVLSPQELGQAAPRVVSASEVVEISSSVQSIYNHIADGIDVQRIAAKKLIYESLCSRPRTFRVPVIGRYPRSTVEKAGFEVDEDDDYRIGDDEKARFTVIGNTNDLATEIRFTSRDGSTRPHNAETAQALTQLVSSFSEVILQNLGKRPFFQMLNEILRASGTTDVIFELPEEDAQFEIPGQGPQQQPGQAPQNTDPNQGQPQGQPQMNPENLLQAIPELIATVELLLKNQQEIEARLSPQTQEQQPMM